MKITLNQLIREFKILSDAHGSINSFFFGSYFDAISRDAVQYPLLCATIQPSNLSRKKTSVTISFTLADKYTIEDYEEMNEVHSDLLQIVAGLRAVMRSPRWRDNMEVDENVTYSPFQFKGSDVTAGYVASLIFHVDDFEDFCAEPIFDYDFGKDIGVPIVCADASYLVQYENGTPIQSGTIPSGGSEVIEVPNPPVGDDATVENSDVTFQQLIPSGDTYVLDDYEFEFQVPAGNIVDTQFRPAMVDETFIIGAFVVCPPLPPVVYDRPVIGQLAGYQDGDTYDQYITQNYWIQEEGFKRIVNPDDILLLADLDSIGVDNRNPHGDFRRFTMGDDPNDTSLSAINLDLPSSQNLQRYIVDWLTGTAWFVGVYLNNKTYFQSRDLVNTPYDGTTPNWNNNMIAQGLASNGLPYGFSDWKIASFNHVRTIWSAPSGINQTLFNQASGTLNAEIQTADLRVAANYRVRFDGIGGWISRALTNANTGTSLYCRRVLESDY